MLEGIDGCGKTTQLQALAHWLPASGLLPSGAELVVTREPGGTPLGLALRELLLHPPGAAAPGATAELLLYAADRAQHVQQRIRPALEAGHWVLSDRFSGSTAAYQGYGRGLSLALIQQLEAIATAGLVPDLTLWLDLPLAESRRRRAHRAAATGSAAGSDGATTDAATHSTADSTTDSTTDAAVDRIEAAGEFFLQRVAAGFAVLAAEGRWCRIDASLPPAAVTAACCERLRGAFGSP